MKMSLNDSQYYYFTFELEYKSTKKGQIKLFDSKFVNKNKEQCKIIYNEKEYELTEYFKLYNNHNPNDSIKIHLKINNNITDISYMFSNCKELLSFCDISFDNSNITDISKSFYENNTNNINDESYNYNETDKSEIFYNDDLILSTIQKNTNINTSTGRNDLRYFKEKILTNVTNMRDMFYGCHSLISLPDISKWDTKNVTDMRDMFYGCHSLISLSDISKWDTKNVNDMLLV